MKPRFEPDNQSAANDGLSPTLIDPEGYDASEQAFAASLEETVATRPLRFVVEEATSQESADVASRSQFQEGEALSAEADAAEAVASTVADVQAAPDPESWRREVAARLSHYRARRRPREPRYPSLQLKFEAEPVWSDPVPGAQISGAGAPSAQAAASNTSVSQPPANVDEPLPPTRAEQHITESRPPGSTPRIRLAESADYPRDSFATTNEATAKVIEFASYSAPPRPFDELAEPVFDRPRIIEAPELVPPPPALGGISIEPHSQLNSLEGIMQAISSSAERVGWIGMGPAVALLICISNLGGVGAYLAALSRIPFVAGIDRFLPPAFARIHPKWGTPYVSLIVQALCCVLFIVLGQFGSTVHGAYQVLVSMSIITNFVPYLFMFAAMVRLQREPVEPGVIRVPGGKPVAIVVATVGFVTTCAVILGSMVPDASEPNKLFAVAKILLLNAILFGGGLVLYLLGRRRRR